MQCIHASTDLLRSLSNFKLRDNLLECCLAVKIRTYAILYAYITVVVYL
jgi:hypothetical protein